MIHPTLYWIASTRTTNLQIKRTFLQFTDKKKKIITLSFCGQVLSLITTYSEDDALTLAGILHEVEVMSVVLHVRRRSWVNEEEEVTENHDDVRFGRQPDYMADDIDDATTDGVRQIRSPFVYPLLSKAKVRLCNHEQHTSCVV